MGQIILSKSMVDLSIYFFVLFLATFVVFFYYIMTVLDKKCAYAQLKGFKRGVKYGRIPK